jgi:hypothetical protein
MALFEKEIVTFRYIAKLFIVLTISLPPCSFGQIKPITSNQETSGARVPFVACRSDGQAGPRPLPTEEKVIQLNPAVAEKLAYYESSVSRGILAPRGWSCYGVYGSSGSAFVVTPEPIALEWPLVGPIVEVDSTSGDTSGRLEVATVVVRVFPKCAAGD